MSGVRSWCEASATKASWLPTRSSSRAVVRLKALASERTSGGPLVSGTRRARSPSPMSLAASSISRSGRVMERAMTTPTPATTHERHQGHTGQAQPVAAAAVVDLAGRVGHPHRPPYEASRGHGHGGVHEVGAERVGAAGAGAHLAASGRPGPPGGWQRSRSPGSGGSVSRRASPSASTTTTRLPSRRRSARSDQRHRG